MLDQPRSRRGASDQSGFVEKDCACVGNLDMAAVGDRLKQTEQRYFMGRKSRCGGRCRSNLRYMNRSSKKSG